MMKPRKPMSDFTFHYYYGQYRPTYCSNIGCRAKARSNVWICVHFSPTTLFFLLHLVNLTLSCPSVSAVNITLHHSPSFSLLSVGLAPPNLQHPLLFLSHFLLTPSFYYTCYTEPSLSSRIKCMRRIVIERPIQRSFIAPSEEYSMHTRQRQKKIIIIHCFASLNDYINVKVRSQFKTYQPEKRQIWMTI